MADPGSEPTRRRWWQTRSGPPSGPSGLAAAAAERGWPVTDGDPGLDPILAESPLRLTAGHHAGTVARGHAGSWDCTAFEVVFPEAGRIGRPQFAISVLPVPIPLPVLRVAPWRFLNHKAGGLLVQPTGDPEFDARWQILVSADSADLRGLTDEPLRRALLASPDLDEIWTAAGHVAASRVDGYHSALLTEHAALLTAAMTGLRRSL